MNLVLLANIVSFAGACIMVWIGFLRRKESILAAQCVQFAVMGVGNLLLGGVTGFVSNLVSIVRNLVCARREFTLTLKLVFIAAQAAVSLSVNTQGLLGWLPVFSACLLTWFMDTKNDILFKAVITASSVMWSVYDFTLCNFSAFVFDLLAIGSNIAGVLMIRKSLRHGQP